MTERLGTCLPSRGSDFDYRSPLQTKINDYGQVIMKDSNARKAETLGMPHGTASNRLRKIILFSLLVKHEENICFKCQQPIETVDDLSVEHKKPWEGISAELFWDLENIAFSHLRCNRPDRPGYRDKTIPVPERTTWCGGCDSPQPKEDFTSGAKNQCFRCKKKHNALRNRKQVQSDVGIVAERHLAKV